MYAENCVNGELIRAFERWHRQNLRGGWGCRWRRRSVWTAQLKQKLGWQRQVAASLFWGERMQVITGETVSSGILPFGYGEPTITALMLRLLRKGQTMVDVGTHFGYEALLGCKLVGASGHVICFEPNPSSFALAQRNLSRFPQVVLHQEAVSADCKVVPLEDRPIEDSAFNQIASSSTRFKLVQVPTITLDKALDSRTQPIDFIKVDVEGAESDVLRGAHTILSENAPVLVLEADMPSEDGKVSARAFELANYLRQYSYQAYNFDFTSHFCLGPLNSFPVHHANILFMPMARPELFVRIRGV